MVHSFSCKNFYSFRDTATVCFVVNEKAPNNEGYFIAPSGVRLSKAEVVIGPNASGKTNLLKVLPFLKWLITSSFKSGPSDPLPVKPFLFGDQKGKPSELSVEFEIDGNIYRYSFSLNESRILFEELRVKNKTKQKVTSKKLFSRVWDEKTGRYELDDRGFNFLKEFEGLLRANASALSSAALLNHKKSLEIFDYWQRLETNVVEAGWVGDHLLPNAMGQFIEALKFYSENDDVKKEAEKFFSRFDLGLKSFDIVKEKSGDGTRLEVSVRHSFGMKESMLPLPYESSGTKQLLVLLKAILLAVATGSVVVMDEFDVNLHPELVSELFETFVRLETNPKNAQILFSTHSHPVLSRLDKYQIALVEKNEDGASETWRLDEVSGVRADDNYYAKYIAGAYGATPKL